MEFAAVSSLPERKADPFSRPAADEELIYPGIVESSPSFAAGANPARIEELLSLSLSEGIKRMGKDALLRLFMRLSDGSLKPKEEVALGQWILEKITGKASQSVDVKHSSLDRFTDLLESMKAKGETLDVSPQPLLLAAEAPEARSAEGEDGATQPERNWDSFFGAEEAK